MKQVSLAVAAALAVAVIAMRPRSAAAAERDGVTMPDRITAGGKPLYLRGMGVHEVTIFRLDVFVAGLYLERPDTPSDAVLTSRQIEVLHLHFKRGVSRSRLVKGVFAKLHSNLGEAMYRRLAAKVGKLAAMIPSFGSGDTMTLCHFPGRGLEVEVNGKPRGIVASERLARSVFALWLGPHPISASIKRDLLGRR